MSDIEKVQKVLGRYDVDIWTSDNNLTKDLVALIEEARVEKEAICRCVVVTGTNLETFKFCPQCGSKRPT